MKKRLIYILFKVDLATPSNIKDPMGLIGSNQKSEFSKLSRNKMIDHIQNPYPWVLLDQIKNLKFLNSVKIKWLTIFKTHTLKEVWIAQFNSTVSRTKVSIKSSFSYYIFTTSLFVIMWNSCIWTNICCTSIY